VLSRKGLMIGIYAVLIGATVLLFGKVPTASCPRRTSSN